jgi:multiple sugar transport system permease protein
LICILPPLWVIISSTKESAEFFAVPPTIIPRSFDFSKLVDGWKTFNFGRFYMNTIYITLGSVAFSVICNGLAGYVISKLKPKGIGVVFAVILGTLMIPGSVSMVPTYKNIISLPILHFNLINTFFPMWMMAGANAFMIIVYKSFFDGISTSFIEAGRLDGCNDLDVFVRIVLPLSKPVIFTSVILTINGTWGDFFWPYMVLKDKALYTVIVEVFQVQSLLPINKLVVLLSFAIVPPIILFCFFQKYIMQGFTMSGIKG